MRPDFQKDWKQTPGDEMERHLVEYFSAPEPDTRFAARLEADLKWRASSSRRARFRPMLGGFAQGMALGAAAAVFMLALGWAILWLIPPRQFGPVTVAELPTNSAEPTSWSPDAPLPTPAEYAGALPTYDGTPIEVEPGDALRQTSAAQSGESPPRATQATPSGALEKATPAGTTETAKRTETASAEDTSSELPQAAAQERVAPLSEDLVVEFYPLGEELSDPDELEQGTAPAPPEALEARADWREDGFPGQGELNEALESFGYRIELSRLYQGENLVLEDIRIFDFPWFDPDAKIFALPLERGGIGGEYYLVRPDGVLQVESTHIEGMSNVLRVREGEKEILQREYNITPYGNVVALLGWEDGWGLELVQLEGGDIYLDGGWLNEQHGYTESFGLHRIEGKPLYFFEEDGVVRMHYAGQIQPLVFDQVVHYTCCSAAPLDLQGNDKMVWFYARQGEEWYYVEMGAFPQQQ